MTEKIPVPNINPETGLSRDFKFALGPLYNLVDRINPQNRADNRSIHLARVFFRTRAYPTYEGHFPSDKYDDVINDSNRENVATLDSIVNKINEARRNIPAGNSQIQEDYDLLNGYVTRLNSLLGSSS